jgi:RimJ/RimL family protein N-acetyltransferase
VDWRSRAPRLRNRLVLLREMTPADAVTLAAQLRDKQVREHLSAAPRSALELRRFARWARAGRSRGSFICFVIVPAGSDKPVGMFQIWPVAPDFSIAEWGFVIGRQHWGTGLFTAAADLLFEFVFGRLGVKRLEARSLVGNGRGNGALRKVGAVAEGRLRMCGAADAMMWSILADDYAERVTPPRLTA